MENSDEILTYTIPEWNIPTLEARVQKLNKRAIKLGCEPLSIIVHEEKMIPDPKRVRPKMLARDLDLLPKIKMVTVSIDGATPKLAGWKFVGTLDHYSLPGKVIVNTVPGEVVPQHFHNGEAICDHCGKIRYRKETFVVENDEGETQQVGRQCLKDFLGHNPQGLVGFLQSLYDLASELEDEEGGFRGGYGEYYYELKEVLKITAAVIRNYGWTPRSAANEDRPATAGHVSYAINQPYGAKEIKLWKEFIAKLNINDEDGAEGEKAVQWLLEQEDANEYIHNIKMIAEAGQLTGKLFGYACSIVAAYQRAMEKLELAKAERAKKLNEWVDGEVKQRLNMVVTVENTRLIDSYYGTVTLYRMLDEQGRTITWFANSDVDMEKGKTYRIAATIKKFDEYKDWKQTTVTRVRVLEEVNT